MDESPWRCELCGEEIKCNEFGLPVEDMGEFINKETNERVVAHAQCGIDNEMELA